MKSYQEKPEEKTTPSDVKDPDDEVQEIGVEQANFSSADEPVVDEQEEAVAVSSDKEIGITDTVSQNEASLVESEGDRLPAPPLHETWRTIIAFWGVILLGAILRFWQLGVKPLHHDESLHAYFSLQLMHNNIENWASCLTGNNYNCYHYDPLTHGPFQFHAIATVYKIAQIIGAPDHGVNTTTVRIAAALLGTIIVGLPYFLKPYLGKLGAWFGCFLLAVSPSMVYFARFAREDVYMACFTLLLVVAMGQYIRTRKVLWFVLGTVAFALSYATKEATFLTIAVFGSFLIAVLAWEIGKIWTFPRREQFATNAVAKHLIPQTLAPIWLVVVGIVGGVGGLLFFSWLKNLSLYITANAVNTKQTDQIVAQLKDITDRLVPWLGIALAVVVVIILLREQKQEVAADGSYQGPRKRKLLARIDQREQPLLFTLLSIPWTHLFFGFVLAWAFFLVLFTALFTYIPQGIGDGIWQGIYYWLQQQQVARGGQPWYYYIMLIPLYEQIGLVFGLVGIVYSLLHPSRFRLFLVYWFIGNLFIYSWAAEKMPWLVIHIMMPLLLLGGIGLQLIAQHLLALGKLVQTKWQNRATEINEASAASLSRGEAGWTPRKRLSWLAASSGSILGVLLALLTLTTTLQNMVQVNYIHPAGAQYEMMIYVQTTPWIDTIMQKVDELDQKLAGGKHQLRIGVTSDASWPYKWYLRDYPNTCFDYPAGCPGTAADIPIIISGGDNIAAMLQQHNSQYQSHIYEMRAQWNQGYMPPPCIPTPSKKCEPQQYVGVGPLSWLSYGNNLPHPGQYDYDWGRIMKNVWQWWWYRTPFGGIDTGYQMILFIHRGLDVKP